jgi:5'-3' exonuclease
MAKNTIYKYFTPTDQNTRLLHTQNIVFIDGSYYCFYRYHAVLNWMKHKRGGDFILAEATEEDRILFLNTFKNTFIETLNSLPKHLKISPETTQIIVSQDCPRGNIWRTNIYPEYKGSRKSTPEIGDFFRLVEEETLFLQCSFVSHIIGHPNLEADDCIALSVKYLHQKTPNHRIYIIASDKDYLQLARENVKIMDLKFRDITQQKSSTNNPADDLQIKIIMGDPSDNIPAIFPKCGPKTAKKCLDDPVFFASKLADPETQKKYAFNQQLICFDFIPENLAADFLEHISF